MKIRTDQEHTRREPRLRVFDLRASSVELSFVVLDFSSSGLCIESRESIHVGQDYHFTLEHHGLPVAVAGQARWCKVHRTIELGRGEFETIFRAGFVFKDAPPEMSLPASYLPITPPRSDS